QNIAFQQDTDIAYRKLKKKFRHISLTGDELKYKMEFSNKVWICWFQGEEHAPELIKTCIQSMRNQLQGREIIVLTEKNISDYTEIPGYIIEKYKKGWISRAHYSDILRIDLLCRHGGLWVDATVLNTGGDFSNLEVPLFVYKSLNLSRKDSQAIVASSWLISSYSNHPILLYTRKLLWAYWRRKNSLCNYFLFHICFTIATERYPIEWSAVPTFNNHSPHILHFELNEQFSEKRWEQLKHISAFHKLNHHIDYSSGVNTFYKFIVSSKV
ncbi:TPA: capsular polysaccharide synthesis protein, partial [Streptococcus pneumoniae]|nr:capsular polysaccharide synthesis protein [Streptococcus pneumoniae]HEV0727609.1 capsular polysaccharide synthesis protein [Streptococcus pneumoniae]